MEIAIMRLTRGLANYRRLWTWGEIPRYFKFVDAFPMTVMGKAQKYLMRQASIQELRLQDAAAMQTA